MRRRARTFARQRWSQVDGVYLDMVTDWADPEGFSRWRVRIHGNEDAYVMVHNCDGHAELLP